MLSYLILESPFIPPLILRDFNFVSKQTDRQTNQLLRNPRCMLEVWWGESMKLSLSRWRANTLNESRMSPEKRRIRETV